MNLFCRTNGYVAGPDLLDLPHMQAALPKLARLHAGAKRVAVHAKQQQDEQEQQDLGERVLAIMEEYKDEISLYNMVR